MTLPIRQISCVVPWGIYLPLDRLGVHPPVCGAGKCIEPCGTFVSESEAPCVFMSAWGSGSPFGWGAVGVWWLSASWLPAISTVSRCRYGRPGSAIGPLTCGRAEDAPDDSPAFTPFVPAALGPM